MRILPDGKVDAKGNPGDPGSKSHMLIGFKIIIIKILDSEGRVQTISCTSNSCIITC